MSTRKKQAEKTKQEILLAFFELISEKAFDEIKINDICKSAKVSVGTYYYYFKDKSDCVKEILYYVDAQLEPQMQTYLALPLKESILAYMDALRSLTEENIGLQACIAIYQAQMQMDSQFFTDEHTPFAAQLKRLLQAKEITEEKSKSICRYLLNIYRGSVYSWCLLHGNVNLKLMIDDLLNSYLDEELA